MQIHKINQDIKVFYITANTFPEGIEDAHKKLHQMVKFDPSRNYFGISCPDKTGKIIYKAAAQELNSGEFKLLHLDEMFVSAGNYLYIDITNFKQNIPAIGEAFHQLTHDKRIDQNGFCLEWYMTDTVCRCLIKMKH